MSEKLTNFGRKPRSIDEDKDRDFSIYDSDFHHYTRELKRVDKEGHNGLGIIIEALQRTDFPVVIDLMASTAALVSLKDENFFPSRNMSGLAVSYSDRRAQKRIQQDYEMGIEELGGDLGKLSTWKKIQEWLGNRKANLIMERGYAGLHYVPTKCSYYKFVIGRLWDMLDPNGGVVVLQTPNFETLTKERNIKIEKWLKECRALNIYTRSVPDFRDRDTVASYGLVLLRKNTPRQSLPWINKDSISDFALDSFPERISSLLEGFVMAVNHSTSLGKK